MSTSMRWRVQRAGAGRDPMMGRGIGPQPVEPAESRPGQDVARGLDSDTRGIRWYLNPLDGQYDNW